MHTVMPDTPIGPLAVVWSEFRGQPMVDRIHFANSIRKTANLPRGSCREIDALCKQLRAFTEGAAVRFSLDIVRLDRRPPFHQRVLRRAFRIPRGRVMTYGSLAAAAGCPGGARAVGRALATNPFPLIIPCHRVIRSDGALGGFGGGLDIKRRLLAMEGVCANVQA